MSQRGGKRQGAGRKAGEPNKRTQEQVEKIEASGLTPLEYMLNILRDKDADAKDRMWAAEKAAPYVHAKLATVTHQGNPDSPVEHNLKVSARELTDDELARIASSGGK